MITLKKLASLKEGTRQRKYVRLLRGFEEDFANKKPVDQVFLKGLLALMGKDHSLPTGFCKDSEQAFLDLQNRNATETGEQRQICNDLRHGLLKLLDMEPGDWDLMAPSNLNDMGKETQPFRQPLPVNLYLDDIRSPFNVGSLFRTGEAMGVKHIYLSPGTASPTHNRARRSAMGAIEMVPWSVCPLDNLVLNHRELGFFSLELGGDSLEKFSFPLGNPEGCMILGSEELGVSPAALELSENSLGRVSLPMRGIKGSLNVAVAAGIVLHHWADRFT